MARTSTEANHDDRFSAPLGRNRALRFKTQEIGKRQPADGQSSNSQEATPRNSVAERVLAIIEKRQHEQPNDSAAGNVGQDKACAEDRRTKCFPWRVLIDLPLDTGS